MQVQTDCATACTKECNTSPNVQNKSQGGQKNLLQQVHASCMHNAIDASSKHVYLCCRKEKRGVLGPYNRIQGSHFKSTKLLLNVLVNTVCQSSQMPASECSIWQSCNLSSAPCSIAERLTKPYGNFLSETHDTACETHYLLMPIVIIRFHRCDLN